MPTASQPSQFDPAYAGMMSRLSGQEELGAGPAPGLGHAEGGAIDPAEEIMHGDVPPEIKEVAMMALQGQVPPAEASQILNEINDLFPGLIESLTNQIRVERMHEDGADSLVSEGFLPPYPDNGPQGNGRVDDSLAIEASFKDDFEKRLAQGGPLPVRALLAGGEYIVNAQDAEAGRDELIDAAARVAPGTPPGAAVWDDFVGNINR